MLSGKLRKGGVMVRRSVQEIGRLMKRMAIIVFLVIAGIVGAAKVVDHYLSTTCISGFGTFNQACLAGAEAVR
jgi:hypothetical protein